MHKAVSLSTLLLLTFAGVYLYTATGYIPCIPTLQITLALDLWGLTSYLLQDKPQRTAYCYNVFAGIAFLLSCWGLLQYIGFLPSMHGQFAVTGPFDNPAGIGMCLAALLPYLLQCFVCKNKSRKRLRLICVLLTGAVIVLSGSRTGMLAAGIACTLSYARYFQKKHLVILLFVGLIASVTLYLYKPVSANGRLFMLWISMRLASEHIWLGNGWETFDRGYMLEQAAFFLQHPHSYWIQVADDVRSPFNEYILFILRFGLLGVLALSILGIQLYRWIRLHYTSQKHPALASVCALAICGCFSYPSYYPGIVCIGIISLGILCTPWEYVPLNRCRHIMYIGGISALLTIASAGYAYYNYAYERVRLQVEQRAANGEHSQELDRAYKQLYQCSFYGNHAVFLYNYALYQYEQGRYEHCLEVLQHYRLHRNDYEGQLLYGYALSHLSRPAEAINAFQLASTMLPGRLQPRYELMRLYDAIGHKASALTCAREALALPVKTHNLKTDYLRNAMNDYITASSATQRD